MQDGERGSGSDWDRTYGLGPCCHSGSEHCEPNPDPFVPIHPHDRRRSDFLYPLARPAWVFQRPLWVMDLVRC